MLRDEIIQELKRYFKVSELVCNHTFAKFGESSWQFLDTDFLHVVLVLRRDILQRAMTCNHSGANQRGLRCNRCDMVKAKTGVYLSAHVLGKAADFTVSGMTAEEARKRIQACSHLLPCNIRLEAGVSWLHVDTLPQYGIQSKVYLFKV